FLSCTHQPIKTETNWGVFKDVSCAGNDSIFQFLENVLNEVMTLFPFEYIHVGGDEVPKYRWDNCSKCTERKKALGLKDSDELQQYFINRMNEFLLKSQKKLIGWDEILDGGTLHNVTVQSWRGIEGAVKAAKTGNDAIMSPTAYAYFDHSVDGLSLSKVYSFEPIPNELSVEESKHILGGECNLWTEHITANNLDNMVFPRLLAMSEVLWSPKEHKSFNNFKKRLDKHYVLLKQKQVNYGFEDVPVIYKVGYVENKGFTINLTSGQIGSKLFYQIENNDNNAFKPYTVPLVMNSSFTIKAKASYKNVADTTLYIRKLVLHKALGKTLSLINPYSANYSASGANSLIDGQKGTNNFRDGIWQGFQKKDMEAIIDLKNAAKVQYISAGFLQSVPSWIFYPEWVEFSGSMDGKTYTSISKVVNSISMKDENTTTHDFETTFPPVTYRYIKVIAKSVGICPEWHNGAGGEAWVFSDEIIIK
ncbi:MAG: family 20 glycosylhydrolase, partial [Bacteroidota bacterium]